MHRPLAAALFFAVVAAQPVAARAQDLAAICERIRHPRLGAWSEFKFVGGRNDGATLRMSVVGGERREGVPYIWLEVAMRGLAGTPGGAHGSETMITKLLVPGLAAAPGSTRATVIKVGAQPAMEMPAGRSRPAPGPGLQNCRNAKVIGWESVTVPGGTYRALHVTNASGRGDSWIDPGLPLALVKEASDVAGTKEQLVLIGHGTGAQSQITERPRPYDAQAYRQMIMGTFRQRP